MRRLERKALNAAIKALEDSPKNVELTMKYTSNERKTLSFSFDVITFPKVHKRCNNLGTLNLKEGEFPDFNYRDDVDYITKILEEIEINK